MYTRRSICIADLGIKHDLVIRLSSMVMPYACQGGYSASVEVSLAWK
jgi:hypothetical protein